MAIIPGTPDVDYVSRANDPAKSTVRFARNAAEATWPFVKIEDTMREGTQHLQVDITLGALASPNPDAVPVLRSNTSAIVSIIDDEGNLN